MTLIKYINFLSLVAIKILICKVSIEYKGASNFYKNLRYHIFIAKIRKNKAHLFNINCVNLLDIFLDRYYYTIVIIIHTNYSLLQLNKERKDI